MSLPVPTATAVGRIGMVAALQRMDVDLVGRLVLVRHPIGMVRELLAARSPVFAWQVVLLGEPVPVNGLPTRELIVADRCLKPVSQVPLERVEAIAADQAKADLDQLLHELRDTLDDQGLVPDDLDPILGSAFEQALIRHALQVAPIAQVLSEVGFRQVHPPHGGTYRWIGVHNGTELSIEAGPYWFGHWSTVGFAVGARESVFDERQVLPEWSRGKVIQTLAQMWRTALPRAPLPDAFALGEVYENHQEDLRRAHAGLPFIEVMGEDFRRARRWLAEAWRPDPLCVGPPADSGLMLQVDDGMLIMRTSRGVVGMTVCSGWMDASAVSLRMFLGLPPWIWRGHRIRMESAANWVRLPHGATVSRVVRAG